MGKKKKTNVILPGLTALAFMLACFSFVSTTRVAQAELNPSIVTPDAEKEMNEWTTGIASPSVFSGSVQEVLPFQADPFTKFKLNLAGNDRKDYAKGDDLRITGQLSFVSNAGPAAQAFLKNCVNETKGKNECLNPPVYLFPSLSNVAILVQVWRKDESGEKEKKETVNRGDFLIDEFYALEGANITENETKNFVVNWTIPRELKEGNYYLAFYVNAAKSFDLSGTPLAPLSWARTFDFRVKPGESEQEGYGVELDKDNITVNGEKYDSRQFVFPVTADDNNEVAVETPVTNLNPEEKTVAIQYDLFRWNHSNPANLLGSKKETVVVAAGEKTLAKFAFSPNALDASYDLKITASAQGNISSSNIRLSLVGKDQGVFRFLGLAKGQEGYLPLFCVRDAAENGLFQGKVRVTMTGKESQPLGNFEQDANIKSETRCFVIPEMKTDQNSCLSIKGEILDKQGRTVDTKEIATACERQGENKLTGTIREIGRIVPFQGGKKLIFLFVIFAFAVGGGILYLNNKHKINGW